MQMVRKRLTGSYKGIKDKTITFSKTIKLYKISISTLLRHVCNKVSNPGTKNLDRFNPAWSLDFEDELVSHIKHMQKTLFGSSFDSLRKLAHDDAQANGLTVQFNEDTSKFSPKRLVIWLFVS